MCGEEMTGSRGNNGFVSLGSGSSRAVQIVMTLL